VAKCLAMYELNLKCLVLKVNLHYVSSYFNVNKNPTDAAVCRYLLTVNPDQTTLEGSSGTSSMTCTGGYGYSF